MSEKLTRPLLLVGCGKMGGAMLAGWQASGITAGGVTIVEPMGITDEKILDNAVAVTSADGLAADLDPAVVVFAVKPQQMDSIAPQYARFVKSSTVFLSIAAGCPISFFEKRLGENAAIVRAMPNTPAAIGQGITVTCPNGNVSAAQSRLCVALMEAVGEAASVDDESLIDAITAVSGSGPAYVFYLIECMTAAGVASGLPQALAARLALATVAGAGQLALTSDETPSKLRENVSSPGGTTLAALSVLMADDGMAPLFKKAIAAAAARSRELAAG